MPTYKAPVSDTVFLLNDVFDYARYANAPGFAEAPIDVVEQVLTEGAKFVEEVVQPLNRVGDIEGCTRLRGWQRHHAERIQGGLQGLRRGRLGRPLGRSEIRRPRHAALSRGAAQRVQDSANLAFAMYPGLTNGAVAAMSAHASDELKDRYLPKMTTGEWTGTMNLTEPHCGTDLGLIKTKAVPQPDGSYAITGQKIFISAGEHDLADNIIHLVNEG